MSSRHSSRATVATVAELAGVSVASVSRVLNGLPATPEMEQRVRDAAKQLGYVPNATARSLKSRRTQQLGFAVEDVGNPVYVEMMRAISRVTKAAGYRLLLHSTDSDREEELRLIHDLNRGFVDGLILSPIRISDDRIEALVQSPVPVVVIGTLPDDVPIDNVRADSRSGIATAVAHLFEGGCRRIAMLNGPLDTVPGEARRAGYERGLAGVGVALDEALVETATEFTAHQGYESAKRLLAREKFDGLVCANDLIAVGAMRAIREHGLTVPDDVAVVGVDNTELATTSTPQLTSVTLNSSERGRTAAELLLARIDDPALAPCHLTLPPRLIVRESSSRNPAGLSSLTG